jgi:hypothetical protein
MLGRQKIYAEFLDTTDGVWFANFDPARHVSLAAAYDAGWFVRCAIGTGTSRHTTADRQRARGRPARATCLYGGREIRYSSWACRANFEAA